MDEIELGAAVVARQTLVHVREGLLQLLLLSRTESSLLHGESNVRRPLKHSHMGRGFRNLLKRLNAARSSTNYGHPLSSPLDAPFRPEGRMMQLPFEITHRRLELVGNVDSG
jgi:hypothetical protein